MWLQLFKYSDSALKSNKVFINELPIVAYHPLVTASADTINANINNGLSGSTEEDNTSVRELWWPWQSEENKGLL